MYNNSAHVRRTDSPEAFHQTLWTSPRHGQSSRAPSQYASPSFFKSYCLTHTNHPIAAISATTTGFLGILRGQEHYGFLAGTAAVNSGITAAAFFSKLNLASIFGSTIDSSGRLTRICCQSSPRPHYALRAIPTTAT